MKKVYAVVRVTNEGKPEPLKAHATGERIERYSAYPLREFIETFNSREAAVERARALISENMKYRYDVLESVQAFHVEAPIKTHSF